jgi:menaquinone-dependent protoporphyrinogen oxidase
VLDMDKLNLAEKVIAKVMRAPVGDFRDWDAITAWAKEIAAVLKKASAAS